MQLNSHPAATLAMIFAAITLSTIGSPGAPLPPKPNILLIMADDLGVETLGCYGGTSYATPNLDRLARTGMRFKHCYSMPVCHPTRIALLTGRYPFRLQSGWGTFPKDEERNTLAQVMKNAGYTTAVAGKWQLMLLKNDPDQPQRMGFDLSSVFAWHEGPRYYDPMIYQDGKVRTDTKGRYGPNLYTEVLIDFMRRNKDRPFWAYYPMALCHDVTDDLNKPVPFGPKGRYQNYKEMVETMDDLVGRLMTALDELGLRDKTLILFMGDNGCPSNPILSADQGGKFIRQRVVSYRRGEAIPGGKGKLTNGGTHVPLIANWKGVIEGGQIVEDLVDFSDFLPTLAELAGAKTPSGVKIDGHSFAPRLRGERGKSREWAFAEKGQRRWVRDQQWKLYNNGRFYNLVLDPEEKHPITPNQLPPTAQKAHQRLQQALATLRYR